MIDEFLGLFNRSGPEYRNLVYDRDREENPVVNQINDLNKGALYNSLTWHLRFAFRLGEESSLLNATGAILRDFGKLFNLEWPIGMSAAAFRNYIIGRVVAGANSFSAIRQIFIEQSIKEPQYIGPYLDFSHCDIPIREDGVGGSTFVFPYGALYVLFDADEYDPSLLRAAQSVKAAGIGLFQGIVQ